MQTTVALDDTSHETQSAPLLRCHEVLISGRLSFRVLANPDAPVKFDDPFTQFKARITLTVQSQFGHQLLSRCVLLVT